MRLKFIPTTSYCSEVVTVSLSTPNYKYGSHGRKTDNITSEKDELIEKKTKLSRNL